jgi:predicted kinase
MSSKRMTNAEKLEEERRQMRTDSATRLISKYTHWLPEHRAALEAVLRNYGVEVAQVAASLAEKVAGYYRDMTAYTDNAALIRQLQEQNEEIDRLHERVLEECQKNLRYSELLREARVEAKA